MATAIVIQSTVATGDTIEASRENQNRDNWSVIDVRTGGDPGAAGRIPVSIGSLAAAWLNAGTEGYPLRISSGVPAYAQLTSAAYGAGSIPAGSFAAGAISTADIGAVQVTQAKIAADAIAAANIINGNVTTDKIADGNVTAGKLASGAAVSNIGYTPARVASGTYDGDNGTSGRQIETGFACKFVYIQENSQNAAWFIDNTTKGMLIAQTGPTIGGTSALYLHGSDGFVVADGAATANVSGRTYHYTVFG